MESNLDSVTKSYSPAPQEWSSAISFMNLRQMKFSFHPWRVFIPREKTLSG